MKSVIPARASARALLVAVFGGALVCTGLVGVWAETRAVPTTAPAPLPERVAAPAPSEPAARRPSPVAYQSQALSAGSRSTPRLILASEMRTAAMSPFQLDASGAAQDRALDCLTTAVYYEARGEGSDGMAAVAQVVLNRVRHPAFPKSVCGVVFQGCQFSFACGGMKGRRNAILWSRSREIAEAALGGEVMQRVGSATHFHATRINPRWSGLSRVATIGQHVFYSFSGRRGAPSTFLNVVRAGEPPARTLSRQPEAPVYAMLPSEQADAAPPVAAASTPTVAEPEAEVVEAGSTAEATAPVAVAGAVPLANAIVPPRDAITAPSPIA